MEAPGPGSGAATCCGTAAGRDGIMALFRRAPRAASADRKPGRAERRAAVRTAQAEANLARTEQQIHDLADGVRRDLRGWRRRG
jgi:hypothetical protein